MPDRELIALRAMRRILRATELHAKALSREFGLTATQLLLLQTLEANDQCTVGEIAAHMNVTLATVTTLIHKLESRGLVQRQRGTTDRRQVWMSLTDEGRRVIASAPDGLQDRFRERFRSLADWEQAMLIASLERVAEMLGVEDMQAAPLLDSGELDRSHES